MTTDEGVGTSGHGGCGCRPERPSSPAAPATAPREPVRASVTGAAGAGVHAVGQVAVPAGAFAMGDQHGDGHPADGETPVHEVVVDAFSIDATTVTNADFARFVDVTGHVTEAESFGYSAVFHLLLAAPASDVVGRPAQAPWWLGVAGADWRHPGGRDSSVEGLDDHPVVHVSWHDAEAYCRWASRALPTEAQWEYASRAGRHGRRFPWGDDLFADGGLLPGRGPVSGVGSAEGLGLLPSGMPSADDAADGGGGWRCNIWQGRFPVENTADDRYVGTAPVRAFPANDWGLFQTIGNVWEWCADWFDPRTYTRSPRENPAGPASGTSRIMRGGSYLCHDSYCNRYRNAARSHNTPDSSSGNTGFRTVGPAPDDGASVDPAGRHRSGH